MTLRFCMLTTFYPPFHFGGDAVGIQRLARALARQGHAVTVVHDVDAFHTLHDGPPADQGRGVDDGVNVIGLRSRLGALSPLLTQQTGRPVVHGRRIASILREGRFDVVNFHNVSLVGGPGLLGFGGDAVRIYMAHEHWLVCPTHVLWRHGREACPARECLRCTLHYRRPPQLWRWTGLLQRELKNVDAFIAMSEFSRQKHREFGFPRDMEVLPYCLPSVAATGDSSGTSPHHRPYFLVVGRLERIKGLDDVLPLFRDYPDADLLVAGDGEHAPVLRAIAADVPQVRFLGRLPAEELAAYYRDALALIVPSICFETFGIILIEAFRQGVPVIARRIGPLPEIVARSGAGELFTTPNELRSAMRRMQHDPKYRAELATAGLRAFLEEWTEDAVLPRYLDIVRRAAARRGHARVAAALAPFEEVACGSC